MSRAMLGPLGKHMVGQVTVHAPSPETAQQESFTAFIPSALIADSRIRRGIAVSAEIEGVQVVCGENGKVATRTVWFCDRFDVVG